MGAKVSNCRHTINDCDYSYNDTDLATFPRINLLKMLLKRYETGRYFVLGCSGEGGIKAY